jgi:hypothetical protein
MVILILYYNLIWKEKMRNREQWRLVEEAKAPPGL